MLDAGDRAGVGIGWECLGPDCISQTPESRATAEAVVGALARAAKAKAAHEAKAKAKANKESKGAKRKQRDQVYVGVCQHRLTIYCRYGQVEGSVS